MKFFNQSYLIPFFSGLLLAVLFIITITRFVLQARIATDRVIAEHIEILAPIFKKIDETCKIIGFEHESNYIDFLTVKSFVSSDVGSMHLIYPDAWEGPYLQENLTVQGKIYQIVKAKQGYYIVPGDGVELANGKIIGKTLRFNKNTDMDTLIRQNLLYMGKPLAAPIEFKQPIPAPCLSCQIAED